MKKGLLILASLYLVLSLTFLGCARVEYKEIKIGIPADLKNPYPVWGDLAARLAAEEINEAGGVKVGEERYKLKIITVDSRDMQPGVPVSEALLAVEKLITEDEVDFVAMGPARSEAYIASQELFAKYRKVHLLSCGSYTPGIVAKKLNENYEKYKYLFRVQGDVGYHLTVELPAIYTQIIKPKYNLTKVYITSQDILWARKSGDLVETLFPTWGAEVVGKSVFPVGCTDFSSVLLEAKGKGAEIIYLTSEMPEINIFLKQWSDLEVKALPMGYMGSYTTDPEFFEMSMGKCDYTLGFSNGLIPGDKLAQVLPEAVDFYTKFTQRWGKEPYYSHTIQSYAAIKLLAAAIEQAGTLDADAVVKALEEIDLKTAVGRFRFDENHEVIRGFDPATSVTTCWVQWQEGKRVIVFPPSIADGDILLPPIMR